MKSENADKIKNAFTIQSEHFETHKANFMKKEYLDYVISEVHPQKTDSVLEVVAGTCICGRSFAPYVWQVTCLDLTPALLLSKKFASHITKLNNVLNYSVEWPSSIFMRNRLFLCNSGKYDVCDK